MNQFTIWGSVFCRSHQLRQTHVCPITEIVQPLSSLATLPSEYMTNCESTSTCLDVQSINQSMILMVLQLTCWIKHVWYCANSVNSVDYFTSVMSLHSVNIMASENIRFKQSAMFSSVFIRRPFVVCG